MTAGYIRRLPDGNDDAPDEHGRHTRTVNVMHSADQYKRFNGCDQCKSMAGSRPSVSSTDPPRASTPKLTCATDPTRYAASSTPTTAIRVSITAMTGSTKPASPS
jgi:hypothetical protein